MQPHKSEDYKMLESCTTFWNKGNRWNNKKYV